ncbi:putative glycerol kinase 5 isoform X1 [Argiope bruennichi]|uniref:putative glycerol kinase 5 isoform X1 n=1 Tax=Argiope bruennichi TaxID=94029 RepID=UPI00249533FF|nr:putative glycerol kinase 5 isoform X1 [Argiope bruennichi]
MSRNSMKKHVILGVDVGTTNVKCFAYDHHFKVIGQAHEKVSILDPGDGRHEIEPELLWSVFLTVVRNCLLNSHLHAAEVSCMGISTQRGTFLTWNRETHEAFHNFITWKDMRSEKLCEQWNSSYLVKLMRFVSAILYFFTRKKLFQLLSRLKFTPAMVLTRLRWILKYDRKVRDKIFQNEALFGTIDSWLVWKLTGGKVHATDSSNACVTGFFDIIKMEWSKMVLNACSIPRNILPEVKNTCDNYGQVLPEIFGAAFPIFAVVGDQQASLFGSGCFRKDDINCTMGTGTFLNINTGSEPVVASNGIYTLVGWTISAKTTYILECGFHDVGAVLSVAQNLGFFDHPAKSCSIAESVSDTGDVYFLPSSCSSLCSGQRNGNISSLTGLKVQTSKNHIVRAILESIAFQVRLLLDTVETYYETDVKKFRACGGISNNDFILQLVSDLCKKRVERMKHTECSSLGAALFAGLHTGVWQNMDEIRAIQTDRDIFSPRSISTSSFEMRYLNWKKAVSSYN